MSFRSRIRIYLSLCLFVVVAISASFVMNESATKVTNDTEHNHSHDKFIAYYATESDQAGISDRLLLNEATHVAKAPEAKKDQEPVQQNENSNEDRDDNVFLDVANQMFSVEEPEPINILKVEKVAEGAAKDKKLATSKAVHDHSHDLDTGISEKDELSSMQDLSETTNAADTHKNDKTAIEKFASLPIWKKFSAPAEEQTEKPRVVIIIDDMGLNSKMTRTITKLPAPLELSFLPYASGVAKQADIAREAGHEIMIHMPMEPLNHHIDTGPIALKMGMEPKVFDAHLNLALGSLSGYVGINNHMGSRLTQNKDAMERLMMTLKDKGLLFVDSRTIHTSIAAETAAAYDVPYAIRDVFIDHVPTKEGVEASLKLVEDIALRRGTAIAIGHPKKVTVDALKKWLPTLEKKGIVLTPVSQVVRKPSVDVSKHAESRLLQRQ